MDRKRIMNDIETLLDVMLTKIDADAELLFLKGNLTQSKNKVLNAERGMRLELHAKGMARQVYDNFWDTKDIYYDLVALDALQDKFNQSVEPIGKMELQ